jgi:CHAT domain-containing protein
VVLSACETGVGEPTRGDEVVSLARAFLYAGTPSVVATLWRVDDAATGELMVAFYTRLASGEDKAESLRGAQLAVMEEHESPYFWAPFVLVGD